MRLNMGEWLCVFVIVGSFAYSAFAIQSRWRLDLTQPVISPQPGDFCPPTQLLSDFQKDGQPVCREKLTR